MKWMSVTEKKCGCEKACHFPDIEEDVEKVASFVVLLCDLPTCFDHQNTRFRSCDCLRQLTSDSRVLLVQNLQAHFVLKRDDRKRQIEKVTAVGEGRRSNEKNARRIYI